MDKQGKLGVNKNNFPEANQVKKFSTTAVYKICTYYTNKKNKEMRVLFFSHRGNITFLQHPLKQTYT